MYEIIPSIAFLFIISTFVIALVSVLRTWTKNNNAPRLSVEAVVAKKRSEVTMTQQMVGADPNGAQGMISVPHETLYVVMRVESGDTLTFSVSGGTYRTLQEGQRGKLTFQGTRFLRFEPEGSETV